MCVVDGQRGSGVLFVDVSCKPIRDCVWRFVKKTYIKYIKHKTMLRGFNVFIYNFFFYNSPPRCFSLYSSITLRVD